jgi:cysteine desulfurase/selenocysteine lyase
MALDLTEIRSHFTAFQEKEPPVYLDNAATAQTPDAVISAVDEYYQTYCANVHRGMHGLTERATLAYEDARRTVAVFLGAKYPSEIVFTKNCTESINLVARTWAEENLQKGDTVALSVLEHHSNIVPWQQLAARKGVELEWIGIDDEGNLQISELDAVLQTGKVKLVALTGLSNVLGTLPDIADIAKKAHDAGALLLLDAAQLAAHHKIDVQDVDCDFLALSGHKLYGPTGIGVLYAKRDLLREMPPFLGGGMMINEVTTDSFSAAESPSKFEAGTPPIAQAIGLKAAIEWLSKYSWEDIEAHEQSLLETCTQMLAAQEGVTIFGPKKAKHRSGCISFTVEAVHPHDLTDLLGQEGIALRAGHHCTQPLHKHLGVPATSRVSFGIYNSVQEIDALEKGMQQALSILR